MDLKNSIIIMKFNKVMTEILNFPHNNTKNKVHFFTIVIFIIF